MEQDWRSDLEHWLVPLIAAVSGPKGLEVAKLVDDGIFVDVRAQIPAGFESILLFTTGTVLDPGEDHTSARVRASAGAMYTTQIHGLWETAPAMIDNMPGGMAWREGIEAERPEGERHLPVHEGHLVGISPRDEILVDAAGPALLSAGWIGTAKQIREYAAAAAETGVTEVVMALAGPDISREIAALARALKG